MKEFVEKLREKEMYLKKSDISGFVEKLIERLEENVKSCEISMKFKFAYNMDYQYVDGKRVAFNECVEIVKKLVEEYNQDSTKNNQDWIPCSERLPEDKVDVLVWQDNMHSIAWFNKQTKHWYSNDFSVDESKNVIAWQPLPEPYEREE